MFELHFVGNNGIVIKDQNNNEWVWIEVPKTTVFPDLTLDTTTELTELNIDWLLNAYKNYKNPQQDFFLKNLFFDKLAGTDELRKQIIAGKTSDEIKDSWKKGLKDFQKIRVKYVMYED